jgi:hypothetical protein
MARLLGLANHIEAMCLAIQDTLSNEELDKYDTLTAAWMAAYLADEPLKRVRLCAISFLMYLTSFLQKPKLDSVLQVKAYFRFLGSPMDYNTSSYEAAISPSKRHGTIHTNHHRQQMAKSLAEHVCISAHASECCVSAMLLCMSSPPPHELRVEKVAQLQDRVANRP